MGVTKKDNGDKSNGGVLKMLDVGLLLAGVGERCSYCGGFINKLDANKGFGSLKIHWRIIKGTTLPHKCNRLLCEDCLDKALTVLHTIGMEKGKSI
jgi:hypothetical protein